MRRWRRSISPGTCSRKVWRRHSGTGQTKRTWTWTTTLRPSTGTSAMVRPWYPWTFPVSTPHTGQGARTSRVRAATRNTSPSSATSSMTNAEPREHCFCKDVEISRVMSTSPPRAVTTDYGTEPNVSQTRDRHRLGEFRLVRRYGRRRTRARQGRAPQGPAHVQTEGGGLVPRRAFARREGGPWSSATATPRPARRSSSTSTPRTRKTRPPSPGPTGRPRSSRSSRTRRTSSPATRSRAAPAVRNSD